jgi:succinoglycan biosynthesis transport protein ExoP
MNSLIPISRDVPMLPEPAAPKQPQSSPPPAGGIDLRLITGVLVQRALLAVGVGGTIFLAVLVVFLRMEPGYTASGSILIDPERAKTTSTTEQVRYGAADMSGIDTHVALLKEPALAREIAKRMKLYNDPEFNPAMDKGLFHKPAAPIMGEPDEKSLAIAASRLRQSTNVRHAGFNYVIEVQVSSKSPEKAARLVNATMETYIERALSNKVDGIAKANEEINTQLDSMRREVESAEAAVQQYRNANGLFTTGDESSMAAQEVSTLNQQIASAKADSAEKRAKYRAALAQVGKGSGGADVSAALGSDTIRELRSKEAELSVKLAQLEQDFLPGYPEVKRTRAQLEDIRGQLQSELNRILSSLRAEADASAQRESSLLASRSQAQGGLYQNNAAQVGLVALKQRADSAKQIYEAYITRAKQVTAERSLQQSEATVSSPAVSPLKPSSPNMTLGLIAALALAGTGAGASVLLAELWTKVLRSRHDVEHELGLPFAGAIPDLASIAPKSMRMTAPDFLIKHPFSNFAESFRNVRAFLMLGERNGPAKLVALTSALPKEGKSTTAVCLARTLAMTGSTVVLVDCDLRLRGASKLTGDAERGLVEVVQEGLPLSEALVLDRESGAWILPVGPRQAPLNDLFSRPQFEHVLEQLRERFDYVLLDTPPVLGVADARFLATKADRVLFVAQWNKTPARAARAAVAVMQEGGANVVGAMLTKIDVRKQALFGYSDSSDYFQYYRDYYLPPQPERMGGEQTQILTQLRPRSNRRMIGKG